MNEQICAGVTGDCEAIAKGIYEMMPEEYRTALAFGMLPAPFMQQAEQMFREKVARAELKRYGISEEPGNFKKWCAAVRDEVIHEFNHELALAMLGEAKRQGALLV